MLYLKGIFVPLNSSTDENIMILASLYVNGKMKEYIIQKKITETDSGFTGEVNFYKTNGKIFKQKSYNEDQLVIDASSISLRLKSSPCETNADGIGTFDDYDEWFSANCDSQRFANNTDDTIWVKPEHGDTAFALKPGQWTDTAIDGYSHNGQVHKVTDGYNTGACGDDGFNADYDALHYAGYLLIGGDKDDDWLEERQNIRNEDFPNGDHGWDDLFSK